VQGLSVGGECRVDGTLIYFASEDDPEPFCGDGSCDSDESCGSCSSDCGDCAPFCGDGTCDSDESCSTYADDCGDCPEPEADPHTITCTALGGGIEMEIVGPVTDLLIGELASEPVAIYAGCNGCGVWSVPYGDSDCRPYADWLGDGEVHYLLFPNTITGCNLAVADADGNVAWFDIETEASSAMWNVEGDCAVEGTLMVPR